MQLYPNTSPELVLNLIAKSNPDLPFPLTPDTIFVGLPTVIPVVPPAIANTSARISSKPSGKYTGSKIVSYQRISLANLFLNVVPNVRKYSAAGDANGSPFTLYQLLPFLNELYGIKLSQADVSDATFPAYTTITEGGVSKRVSSVTMTAKATSQAFVGSVVVRTQAGQRDLSTMILKTEIPGRLYPGGNDFVTQPRDRLSCIGYNIDFTENMLTTNPVTTVTPENAFNQYPIGGGNDAWSAAQQTTFDLINAALGISLTTGRFVPTPSNRWNLYGIKAVVVALPNAAYPEANSKDFNRVVVITALAGHTWAAGTMYLHYNF
jgi:hypothetical protein